MNHNRRASGRRGFRGLALPLVVAGVFSVALALGLGACGAPAVESSGLVPPPAAPNAKATDTATPVPEPLIPTATPTGAELRAIPSVVTAVAGAPTTEATASPDVLPLSAATASPVRPTAALLLSSSQRIGFSAPQRDVSRYDVDRLGAGWYFTGVSQEPASPPAGLEFFPLVEVLGSTYSPGSQELSTLARQRPGATWLVGNEPDVIWQDNATPAEYAQVYHEVYTVLKSADPTCQVAIGAISQVTPLRLRYLEGVLAAYQERYGRPMPVDVWNVHLAILREERGSWGVDIPPGLADDQGLLYEIGDNADVEVLKEEVRTFRRWMSTRGLRDRPLIVTEFGVLMPPDYGFPPDRVEAFMIAGFNFMLTATDEQSGYPADGNRLVQRAAWYSLADSVYYTGNLFDPETTQITSLGLSYARYAASR